MMAIFLKITMLKWRALLSWDIMIPIGAALILSLAPNRSVLTARLEAIMITEIGVMIAILGVSLASLAITVSLLTGSLLQILSEHGHGLAEDIWPFWMTSMFASLTAILGILSLSFIPSDPESEFWPIRVASGIVGFFFTWTLVSVVQLVRVVRDYADIRAQFAGIPGDDSGDEDFSDT